MLHIGKHSKFSLSASLRTCCRACCVPVLLLMILLLPGCEREPMLHLHEEGGNAEIQLPIIDLRLEVFWNYELDYGVEYDWRAEWYYGDDPRLFSTIGYTEPEAFYLRRYYTEEVYAGKHSYIPTREYVEGRVYHGEFNWGYWDLLAHNEIRPDANNLVAVDYQETPDSVVYFTNPTMHPVRRNVNGSRFTRAFNQPEEIFAGYHVGEHIDRELTGFEWNEARQAWVKTADLMLYPCTYIYLTQLILHNNRGRVDGVDGNAGITGMAYSVNLNTGKGGNDAISVHYNVGLKPNLNYTDNKDNTDKTADIIGGRVVTFGLCNINASRVSAPMLGRARIPNGTVVSYTASGHPLYIKDNEVHIDDGKKHLIDITMTFSNGGDSTFIFDVTDQVRRRYKGGVITMELDMDTVNIPSKGGSSGFDAVVVAPDSVTYEFEM